MIKQTNNCSCPVFVNFIKQPLSSNNKDSSSRVPTGWDVAIHLSCRRLFRLDCHVASRLSMNMNYFSGISLSLNLPFSWNSQSVIANPDLSGRGDPSPRDALFNVRVRYRAGYRRLAMTEDSDYLPLT
jgi:hypothetical protein